ncbi:MAG: cytochrome b N-terminal domain-containing protein [Planctomycetales bacterium]
MNSILNWLDDRTGCKALLHEALYERVPGGARWRYVWGSTLVFAFSVQVITGLFLWMAYSPSSLTAWESVYYIQYEMQFGWLLRGVHHFTAQIMVVLLALHLMQVIIDGAYKAPREVNFWLGLVLLQITLGLSLTGYLLPWDQKGYWATQVATEIAGIVPVVGTSIQRLVVGGPNYGHHTLTRFFAMHAGVLPGLLIGFLALHIYVFRRHGITVCNPVHRPDDTFWPDQVLKDAVACLGVLAVVLTLVLWHGAGPSGGAELGSPADPAQSYEAARPEWYFLFLFQFLKYFPGESEIYGAIVIPGILFLVLALMPLIGRWKLGHRFNVMYICVLFIGIGALTSLALYDDARGPKSADYKRAVEDAQRKKDRVIELIQGPAGIGVSGARALLYADPKTAGPEVFQRNCSQCHTFDGHDGTGRPIEKPTASDLGGFGTREWIRGFIVNPSGPQHFGPTVNGAFNGVPNGDKFVNGQMAQWAKENVPNMKEREIDAVVEFLLSQGHRTDIAPPNDELVAAGRDFFELGSDAVTTACLGCHEMRIDGEKLGSSGLTPAPELTGYASEDWLRDFLLHPDAEQHYGKRNAMPSYKDRMTEKDLDLLLRWMRHRWYEPGQAEIPSAAQTKEEEE